MITPLNPVENAISQPGAFFMVAPNHDAPSS